jgi:hypothetical protein
VSTDQRPLSLQVGTDPSIIFDDGTSVLIHDYQFHNTASSPQSADFLETKQIMQRLHFQPFEAASLTSTDSTRTRHRRYLVEWVGAGSPPGKEQAETNRLEDTGKGTDCDSVKWALLRENLSDELGELSIDFSAIQKLTYRWGGAGHEDQTSEVCSSLVAESPSGID